MASGDTLAVHVAAQATFPTTNYGTPDSRNIHPVIDFDATTDETIYFEGVLPQAYGASGIDVQIFWMASTATSGTTRWAVAIERHQDDTTDLDSDNFATAQTIGDTCASAAGELSVATIAFTNGAQMDSLAAGESYRISVTRDADGTSGTDDMAGDAELLKVVIEET